MDSNVVYTCSEPQTRGTVENHSYGSWVTLDPPNGPQPNEIYRWVASVALWDYDSGIDESCRESYGNGPSPTLSGHPFQSPGLPRTNRKSRKSSEGSSNDADHFPQVHRAQDYETLFSLRQANSGYDYPSYSPSMMKPGPDGMRLSSSEARMGGYPPAQFTPPQPWGVNDVRNPSQVLASRVIDEPFAA